MSELPATSITIQNHDRDDFGPLAHDLVDVYRTVYADRLDNPFFSLQKYAMRLSGYAQRDGFAFTTGHLGGDLIGYALGYRLPANTGWWTGLVDPVDEQLTYEDGKRTFALNEIMVLPEHRRKGVARMLHDYLMITRPFERRATLLVEQDNSAALAASLSWGYQIIGQLQPFADAPIYHAMVKDPL